MRPIATFGLLPVAYACFCWSCSIDGSREPSEGTTEAGTAANARHGAGSLDASAPDVRRDGAAASANGTSGSSGAPNGDGAANSDESSQNEDASPSSDHDGFGSSADSARSQASVDAGDSSGEHTPGAPETSTTDDDDAPQLNEGTDSDEQHPPEDVAEPLPTLIGNVTFSVPSQTFEAELSVALSSPTVGAEIYYTTDGSLPSADSNLYDGNPLLLTRTTQLRALAYADGALAGLDSTAIYIQRTFDYTSDIPIVVMEGYDGGKPTDKETFVDLALMTFEPVDGVAALSNTPDLATRAGYHLRGQSSAFFEKAPYRVELWDNANQDADYPMLGMPAEADWAMIGPYTDRTLIRNALVYSLSRDMGLLAMELRFAEVFINQDGGPLEESDYEGVYAVTQTIKNQKSRVDLKQLEPAMTGEPLITGGYIFKFDQGVVDETETVIECTGSALLAAGSDADSDSASPDAGASELPGTCWSDLELIDPAPVSTEQLAYISNYLQQFHDALHAEPLGDYAADIDLQSFVDHFIVNEITRDIDSYTRSHYYHKDRGGPLVAGPIWDYNYSLGNFATDLEGWEWEEGQTGTNDWFRKIAQDPAFMERVKARWQQLRPGLLSDAELSARIDEVGAPLVNAAERDFERWPVDEGTPGFGMEPPRDWVGQVDAMRSWLLARMSWLDTQLL